MIYVLYEKKNYRYRETKIEEFKTRKDALDFLSTFYQIKPTAVFEGKRLDFVIGDKKVVKTKKAVLDFSEYSECTSK